MTLMTAPDHPPLIIDGTRTAEPPNSDGTAKPPPNYPRRIFWTVNVVLLILVPILVLLGVNALRDVKEDREDKSRVEFCEKFEAENDIYLETCN
jgi:hypothetical protein